MLVWSPMTAGPLTDVLLPWLMTDILPEPLFLKGIYYRLPLMGLFKSEFIPPKDAFSPVNGYILRLMLLP